MYALIHNIIKSCSIYQYSIMYLFCVYLGNINKFKFNHHQRRQIKMYVCCGLLKKNQINCNQCLINNCLFSPIIKKSSKKIEIDFSIPKLHYLLSLLMLI